MHELVLLPPFLDKQTEALRVISNSEVSKVTRPGLKPGTRTLESFVVS